MPVWLAPVVAGGLGYLGGYVFDQLFGDGDYTPREAFVSTATGVMGGGLLRPAGQTLSRAGKVLRGYGDDVYKVGASFTDDLIVAGYISAPMVSRPARIEIIGGAVAGLVYDIAYGQSSASRSERNASDVGAGGTSSGKNGKQPRMYSIPQTGYKKVIGRRGPCDKGYVLAIDVKTNRWVCVRS